MYKKILVAIDGSELSIFALQEAIKMASDSGTDASLTVLYVSQFIATFDGTILTEADQIKRDVSELVLGKAKPLLVGIKMQNEILTVDGDPAQEICKKAKEGKYELIVLGNRGQGMFTELLTGSVSLKVVQHAHCPVLVVRR